MRKITTVLVLCLLFGSGGVFADKSANQGAKALSLNDAILLAVRNNPKVRTARLQRVVDKFALEVARNEFLPQYTFTAKGEVVEGRSPNYSASPKVSLKTSLGTQLEVGINSSYDYGRDREQFRASLRQPLLRGFGRDITLTEWRNALDREQMNQLVLKDQLQTTVTDVIKAYYKLVEDYNRLDVDMMALQDSMRTLKSTKMKIQMGKIAPMEVTQQEAQLANQRFTITQDQNSIDRDYQEFLVLLGLDPKANLTIEREIPEEDIVVPDMDKSIQIALDQNINYIKQLISLKEKKRGLLKAEDAQRWKLDLTASINKTFRDELHHHHGNGVDPIYDNDFDDKRVGLELEIPLFDKKNQKTLVDAKIGMKKFEIALENERRMLVTKIVNSIRDLKARRDQIKSAQQAVKLSEQSLHVAQRKFSFGRTSMFEITSLRKSLTQRQQALIQQRIAYLNTMAQFKQTLGATLKQWHLTMNEG